MAETTTWPGSVLPVQIRTARKQHDCNDCPLPIEPGDRYEVSATPPHRISEYDVDRWLTWRSHHPRHRGAEYLPGCHAAGARQEKAKEKVTVEYAQDIRACSRCLKVLVDEDEAGWYYQQPVADPEMPGLTFMDRVHECHGQPHAVTPAARCRQQKCGRAIVRCETLVSHGGCSSAYGWIHVYSGAHACEPRSDGPYAQPEEKTGA